MDLANKHGSDPESLKILFSSLTVICKIFYSLNSQVSEWHYQYVISSLYSTYMPTIMLKILEQKIAQKKIGDLSQRQKILELTVSDFFYKKTL